MNQVQGRVAHRLQTLQLCTGQEVQERWWSADRLALVLDALGQPEMWQRFETALNQRNIRVYQLNPQRVRLNSTTVSGYWTVSEDGLFQLGYSKDHLPDLPQLKVMLSACLADTFNLWEEYPYPQLRSLFHLTFSSP